MRMSLGIRHKRLLQLALPLMFRTEPFAKYERDTQIFFWSLRGKQCGDEISELIAPALSPDAKRSGHRGHPNSLLYLSSWLKQGLRKSSNHRRLRVVGLA